MIKRKRTYKNVTDKKILDIWNEVFEEAKRLYPVYFEDCTPELYHDSSYSHLGRCSWTLSNPFEPHVDKRKYSRCIITISTNLKQDYEQIRKTLCHEFGHFVAPKENHGRIWKIRADKIGAKWNIVSERCSSNETFHEAAKQARAKRSVNGYRYRVFCPHCAAEWRYKSNCKVVQHVDNYRCRKCMISLKVETINSKEIIL